MRELIGFLTDRQEIAYAMNFGKFPVLTLNRENRPFADISPDSDYCHGCKCRVAWDSKEPRYEGMTTHGHVYMEDGKYRISGSGACLHASFGYTDVIDMVEEAHATVVHKGQTVILIEDFPSLKICVVRVFNVSKRIDIHCSTVASLEALTEEEWKEWKNNYKNWKRRTW